MSWCLGGTASGLHNVPGAEVVVEEDHGHISDPDLVAERYGWLVRPV